MRKRSGTSFSEQASGAAPVGLPVPKRGEEGKGERAQDLNGTIRPV